MHSSATMVPSGRTTDQLIGMPLERPRSRQKLPPLDCMAVSQEGDDDLGSAIDSTDIIIDWTVSNFVINHRQSDAIKSPDFITAGLKWHLALASGTQQIERDHIAVRMHAHIHSLSLSHSHSHSLTHSLLPSSSLMQPPDRPFPPVDPANVSMSLFLPARGARCGRITCVVWWCGRQCPSLILRHLRSVVLTS
eukprot:m.260245 g.260245  ORF g.260245 m.260245 type:complete len:193 (-) comp26645_c0_seq19:3247-3825(-)